MMIKFIILESESKDKNWIQNLDDHQNKVEITSRRIREQGKKQQTRGNLEGTITITCHLLAK